GCSGVQVFRSGQEHESTKERNARKQTGTGREWRVPSGCTLWVRPIPAVGTWTSSVCARPPAVTARVVVLRRYQERDGGAFPTLMSFVSFAPSCFRVLAGVRS